MTRTAVAARTPAGAQEWIVHSSEAEPWTIRAVGPDGRSFEAAGADLFLALQEVRRQAERKDVLLCCNGARVNARPSPQASAFGGGMVYLLPSLRNPGPEDLVPLLAPAPADQVGRVAEQEAFWSAYQSSTRSSLRALSPVAPLARLVSRTRRSPAWVAEERDGVTVWRRAARG
ncbi:hypothetical protein [Streptomyces sp. bgisy154]|uniref:hypothetical protein n=1 Tax=Streptomyces sp. bgisy154 TaxID=3413794 RepID=UPI003D752202